MTKQWASSFSYREALNKLNERFEALKSQDRIVNAELMPNIHSIDGYFFAIGCAPATVSPTEWLGELLPLIQVADEAPAEAVNLLISYQLHTKKRLEQQQYALPVETDPIAAIKLASPVNSFCHGFEVGYRKIESIWSAQTPKELRKELESQVFALKFFASTEHANNFVKLRNKQSAKAGKKQDDSAAKMRPDQLADQVLKNLPKAADLHVRLGLAVESAQSIKH